MTDIGFVPDNSRLGPPRPTPCARLAAVASLLLGVVLLLALPDLGRAASYLAVLAGAAALTAIAAGAAIWRRVGLVARTVGVLAAASLVLGELLALSVGLPGARGGLGALSPVEGAAPLGLALAVLGLLLVDALRRRPQPRVQRPYAL